jgi:hypothetical protein
VVPKNENMRCKFNVCGSSVQSVAIPRNQMLVKAHLWYFGRARLGAMIVSE